MSRNVKTSALFSLDGLESRRLLSGNVSAAFDGQLLDIRGDNLGNQIAISQDLAGAITVVGQDGTLVNGRPSVTFLNGANIEKLDLRMEAGDDRVLIDRLRVAGDLNADLGINRVGNDFLAVNQSTFEGNFSAYGGRDFDIFDLTGTTVFGDVTIDLAEGAGRSTVTDTSIQGSATFIGGEGGDVFTSNFLTVGLDLKVETKEGNDSVSLADGSALSLGITTDRGADQVILSRFVSAEDVAVETGAGNDSVNFTSVQAGKNIKVNLDAGNDRMTVVASSAGEDAILEGGAGIDTLTDLGLTAGKVKEIKEFEVLL